MSKCIIRQVTEDDIKAGDTNKLFATLHGLSPVVIDIQTALAVHAKICRSPSQFMYVAECQQSIVGTIFVSYQQSFTEGGAPFCYIGTVSVHKLFQKKGIASKLMKYAIEQARREHCSQVILFAANDVSKFYNKLGFRTGWQGMCLDL